MVPLLVFLKQFIMNRQLFLNWEPHDNDVWSPIVILPKMRKGHLNMLFNRQRRFLHVIHVSGEFSQAGLTRENLLIALEPEAASLCCRHLPLNTMKGCSSGFVPFTPGSKYLVFDAGGMFMNHLFLVFI